MDDYITQGYETINTGENSVMVRKKTWGTAGGHVLCALLTVWFTFGIGNVIYALIVHNTAEKVLVRISEAK